MKQILQTLCMLVVLAASAFATMTVTVPGAGYSGTSITVPIGVVDNTDGLSIMRFELEYDPNVLSDPICVNDGIWQNSSMLFCYADSGNITVSGYHLWPGPAIGNGRLVTITFAALPGKTALNLTPIQFHNNSSGPVATDVYNGWAIIGQ